MLLLAPYGGMLSVRGHLLIENILDVVGPIGAVLAGALQGCEEGVGAVVIFEREQLFDTLVQRLPSGGEVFEIGLGHIAQGNKGADLLREPVTRVMALGCLSGLGQFQTLFAPPATPMGGDGAVLEVEGNVVMIGLDGEGFGNRPGGRRIGVAIAWDREIAMDLGDRGVPAIGHKHGQRTHRLGLKALDRAKPGGVVDTSVGHLGAPPIGLRLEGIEVGEDAQRPEVVANIMNGAFFDFAFFLGLPDIAGHRGDVERTQELQELLIEAHHRAVMFNDRGEHVVVDQLVGCALEKFKGMQQATVQGFLSLRMGAFEIEQAAVTCDDRQARECALAMTIGNGPKVTPVDLALGTGGDSKRRQAVLGLGLGRTWRR